MIQTPAEILDELQQLDHDDPDDADPAWISRYEVSDLEEPYSLEAEFPVESDHGEAVAPESEAIDSPLANPGDSDDPQGEHAPAS